jgi:hypothetical protein
VGTTRDRSTAAPQPRSTDLIARGSFLEFGIWLVIFGCGGRCWSANRSVGLLGWGLAGTFSGVWSVMTVGTV